MLFNQTHSAITPLQKDINQPVPMVKILGLQDGVLVGTLNAENLRLSTENEVALVDSELNFTLKFNDVLRKNLLFDVPENMNYIASIRGKNFYNVYSASASKIAPQNRIFFATRAEALSAGYLEN